MKASDLNRDLYCLLGLPFDAIDMDGTVNRVIQAVWEKEKLFISTPNLNFMIAAQKNESFRDSVINSDLSIADGMPIVFMSKLLEIPIKERVAGSSLVDALIKNEELKENPIKVFFFGGEDGVAKIAHQKLNDMDGGLKSVGFLNPGFGSIDDMSTQEIIKEINASKPEFIIVSLGAAKGQAWIEHNRTHLNANVISHLGAVVNFVAGTVKRAPQWVQKIHLEWLWRIKEEPALFNRYWSDGTGFIGLLIRNIFPLRRIIKGQFTHSTPEINVNWKSNQLLLKGSITKDNREEIRGICEQIVTQKLDFTLDLNRVTYIDQAALGLLLAFYKNMNEMDCQLKIEGLTYSVAKILRLNKLDFLTEEE